MVNSWDLTCDKIARYLAPIVYTVMASNWGFQATALCAALAYAVCVCCRMMVIVTEGEKKSTTSTDGGVLSRLFGVFNKLLEGIKSLRSDYTLSLLILNTLVTNIFIYPLSSVLFPVLFKQAPEESADQQSFISAMLASLMASLGIKKKQAWQNYASLVSLGGVFGPFMSSFITLGLERMSSDNPAQRTWVGINIGIAGQLFAGLCLVAAVSYSLSLDTGSLVLTLFSCWVLTLAGNNVFTTYFNSFQQQQLSREMRGRFIANIMMVFTLGNSIGTWLFGRALDSSDAAEASRNAGALLIFGLALKVGLWAALRGGAAQSVMAIKTK